MSSTNLGSLLIFASCVVDLAKTPPPFPLPAFSGNLCGWDEGYEDLPNLYYVNMEGSGICVESCPDETDTRYSGLCVGVHVSSVCFYHHFLVGQLVRGFTLSDLMDTHAWSQMYSLPSGTCVHFCRLYVRFGVHAVQLFVLVDLHRFSPTRSLALSARVYLYGKKKNR